MNSSGTQHVVYFSRCDAQVYLGFTKPTTGVTRKPVSDPMIGHISGQFHEKKKNVRIILFLRELRAAQRAMDRHRPARCGLRETDLAGVVLERRRALCEQYRQASFTFDSTAAGTSGAGSKDVPTHQAGPRPARASPRWAPGTAAVQGIGGCAFCHRADPSLTGRPRALDATLGQRAGSPTTA